MNIAIMSHTKKQDLMVQFCTAYCGVLSKHSVCATNATGRMVADATGLPVHLFLSHEHGGIEQIGQRIIYNEIDMVLFFNSPLDNEMDKDVYKRQNYYRTFYPSPAAHGVSSPILGHFGP